MLCLRSNRSNNPTMSISTPSETVLGTSKPSVIWATLTVSRKANMTRANAANGSLASFGGAGRKGGVGGRMGSDSMKVGGEIRSKKCSICESRPASVSCLHFNDALRVSFSHRSSQRLGQGLGMGVSRTYREAKYSRDGSAPSGNIPMSDERKKEEIRKAREAREAREAPTTTRAQEPPTPGPKHKPEKKDSSENR